MKLLEKSPVVKSRNFQEYPKAGKRSKTSVQHNPKVVSKSWLLKVSPRPLKIRPVTGGRRRCLVQPGDEDVSRHRHSLASSTRESESPLARFSVRMTVDGGDSRAGVPGWTSVLPQSIRLEQAANIAIMATPIIASIKGDNCGRRTTSGSLFFQASHRPGCSTTRVFLNSLGRQVDEVESVYKKKLLPT